MFGTSRIGKSLSKIFHTVMPTKQCCICKEDIFVPNKRGSIRKHMLEQHPSIQEAQERASGAAPLEDIQMLAFRCLKCDKKFTFLESYYQHYHASHGGADDQPPRQ